MKTKAISEMLREQNLSTTGEVTVDGPWGAPGVADHAFPIFLGDRSVDHCIGTATPRIGDGSLKFEIEFIPEMDELPDVLLGTFEVPMIFHVRRKD